MGLTDLILWLLGIALGLLRRLLPTRLLTAARPVAAALQWALQLTTPAGVAGTLRLGQEMANRVRQMLEQSALLAAAADQQEEPLQRRLSGLPPPAAAYLQAALGGPRTGGSRHKIAHLQLTGHMRFLPSSTAAAPSTSSASEAAPSSGPSLGPRKWHSGKVEAYIAAQPPSLVCSATIGLGLLSWVKGYVSLPAQGPGGAWSWQLCSPMRMQDLGGTAGPPAGLDQSALAAHLALAPLFPPALLPSQVLHWRPVSDTSAEATLSMGGSEASAVFTFNRMGQVVAASIAGRSPQAPAAAAATAGAAGAAQRGAGSVAVPGGGQRPGGAAPTLFYYRRHRQLCGMMVPGEMEVATGGSREAGGESFAHFDVASLSAWESLEGARPLS